MASDKGLKEQAAKRQNGELPPDVDGASGKIINPHNPQFLLKVPWYLGESGPTLKHQAVQKADHDLSIAETDRLFALKAHAQKQALQNVGAVGSYRKGACKNCGAMSHKEKDCVERPRSSKRAAWKSGLDIAPDEASLQLEQHGKVSYSTKRDAWQGYDADEYKETIARFERVETERRKQRAEERQRHEREEAEKRAQQKKEKIAARSAKNDGAAGPNDDGDATGSGTESDDDTDLSSDESESGRGDGANEDDDDDKELLLKDGDQRDFQSRIARQGGVGGAQMKTTQRNLRTREDTPKYLRNLDLNSAYYDPKARSMRANPIPNANPDDLAFAGDNFVRYSGDALSMQATQVLCWEMQARGEEVDMISNPSQAEMVHRQFQEKKRELEESKRKAILEKYGSSQGMVTGGVGVGSVDGTPALDARLLLGQTEAYAEYAPDGRVIKGAPRAAPRTKYAEDVFEQNHTAVWGSFFSRSKRQWGYACCHSLVRGAYCTGEQGKLVEAASEAHERDALAAFQARRKEAELATSISEGETSKAATEKAHNIAKRSQLYGEADSSVTLDEAKMKEALRKATENDGGASNKRGYNSMATVDVSAEDIEAWRIKRLKEADPMSALINSDVLLEKK